MSISRTGLFGVLIALSSLAHASDAHASCGKVGKITLKTTVSNYSPNLVSPKNVTSVSLASVQIDGVTYDNIDPQFVPLATSAKFAGQNLCTSKVVKTQNSFDGPPWTTTTVELSTEEQ